MFDLNMYQEKMEKAVDVLKKEFAGLRTGRASTSLLDSISIKISTEITNTHSIWNVIYTDYIHIFQISGMILLTAMIGAIVLTFRQRSGIKRQSYINQISRERSEGVKLVDVDSGKGVKIDV